MVANDYEPRYLAGIQLFNRHDFFEAHEVWEDLWNECSDTDRRFYQALIQSAVALHHYGNGNLRGATKLYGTAKAYMDRYASPYLGLDCDAFWKQMAKCFALAHSETDLMRRDLRPEESLIPTIVLDPAPAEWPEPGSFLEEDD